VSKRGLPTGVQMRHDSHYVDILSTTSRSIGKTIPIDRIEPNPEQPRTEFGDLSELTASIREKGVLEPLLVKPRPDGTYMIIAGERRWRSSKLAGLTEVPCIEMDLGEQDVAEIALIENLQRKDLNVWEEADGLAALAQKFGYTQDEIAKKISKSRSTVTEFMTIAGLPQAVRARCGENNINSKATLLEIARQFDEEAMFSHLDDLVSGKRSPKSKAPKPDRSPKSTAERSAMPHVGTASFNYQAKAGEFELNLTFKSGKADRPRLLKALKEAFDAVKADQA
jgi:ParB family chromosome partitioning protein